MVPTSTVPRVGPSVSLPVVIALVVATLLIAGGIITYRSVSPDPKLPKVIVATGSETGTYHALGLALAELLQSEGLAESVTVRTTEGSVSNMGMIETGAADLAIIQSDTPAHENARLVAPLYEEVLHILVATDIADEVTTIHDLGGRRVALGLPGSGTRQVAQRALDHFRVEVGENLSLDPEEAVRALEEGSIDAAFMLTAIPSTTVGELCRNDAVRFLSLGDAQERGNEADALALVIPNLHATTIPRSTYGTLPSRPVRTVGVTAQLVAASGLDSEFVRRMTGELIQHRNRLAGDDGELSVAARIREHYSPGTVNLPYHSGAVAYYERSQPPFLVEYAEAMSFGLTVLVGVYSGYIALRQWIRRRRKNRIDEYYVEAVEHAVNPSETDIDTLRDRRRALVSLRRKAFSDLVDEKLDANESFAILQEYINAELETIDRRVQQITPE